MDCKQIYAQIAWIKSAALDANARLDNGDSAGIRRALRSIDEAVAAIRTELDLSTSRS